MRDDHGAAVRIRPDDRVGSDAVPGNPRPQYRRPPSRLGRPRRAARRSSAAVGAGRTVAVTGVTHASGEVRPGDLYAALPGARRHGAEFAAARRGGRRGRRAHRPGRRATLAARRGLPVLVVADPRAALGAVAVGRLRRPDRRS